MMFNYPKMAETATSLLTKFGRTCQIITPSIGSYNTNTGLVESVSSATIWDGGTTTWDGGLTTWDGTGIGVDTTTNVKCADFAVRGNQYIGNTQIQNDDRYCLVDASIDEITVDMRIVIDGITWNIIKAEKLAPNGTNVLFKLYIRK